METHEEHRRDTQPLMNEAVLAADALGKRAAELEELILVLADALERLAPHANVLDIGELHLVEAARRGVEQRRHLAARVSAHRATSAGAIHAVPDPAVPR